MNSICAQMYNRRASSSQNNPQKIIDILSVLPGQTVAEIGIGGGQFALQLAKTIGNNGHLFAIDNNPDFLNLLGVSATQQGLHNITTLLTDGTAPTLPKQSLDLIFTSNAYHDLSERIKYFRNMRDTLKPGGQVAIIDHNGSGFINFYKLFGHYVTKDIITKEMQQAGFHTSLEIETTPDFLPQRHFLIFTASETVA